METRGILVCIYLTAFTCVSSESLSTCDEVREVFQLRKIGPAKAVPETPRTGADLQVCPSRNLTCCTRKMEERYQVAARRDFQNLLQKTCSSLKLFLSRNVAAFQEAVEALVRQSQDHTMALLLSTHGDLAEGASAPVAELFTDVGLFVLGAELGLEGAVQRFFHTLFQLVFQRRVEPGLASLDPSYSACVRAAILGGRGYAAFGPAPSLLVTRVAGASLPARLFLQALHLGVEVVNTTEHLPLGRECRRALLRMEFCAHCQARTASRPCTGYCLNVLRGCLASLAEVHGPWREFVRSLEGLNTPHATPDLDQALASMPALIRDAVEHASNPWRSAQVRNMCGHPSRDPARASLVQQGGGVRDSSVPIWSSATHTDDTLGRRRRELLQGLQKYQAFYGGLADHLCVSELASGDSCWNGADVVSSYTQRVVGSGVKAQMENPEVRVKEVDPVINQVIDKLKHINQLLQGRMIPKLGTLDRIEVGSGDTEGLYSGETERPYSGDCDDEDGCWSSGNDVATRSVARTPKLAPEPSSDRRPQNTGPHSSTQPTPIQPGTVVLLVTIATGVALFSG